jgi:signal transduction histidine kinase
MMSIIAWAIKYRRYIGIAAAVIGLWWLVAAVLKDRYEAGQAETQARWDLDTAARERAVTEALMRSQADRDAAARRNQEVDNAKDALLATVTRERDDFERLLNASRSQVYRLAASAATDQRGLDALAGIAERAAEVDRRLTDYDSACRRDAIRFQSLIDQLRPQL